MKIKQFNQELDESFTSLWKGARDALKVRKLGKEAKKEGEKEVYDTYNISEINKLLAKLKNIAYGFYIAITQPGANQNKIHIAIGKYEQFLNQVEFLYKKIIPSESYKSREFTGDDEAHGSEYRATTESLIREGAGLDYSLNNIKNSLLRYKNLLNIMKQVDVEEKTTVKKFINAYNNLGKIPEKPVAEPKPVEPSVEDFESSKTEEPEIKNTTKQIKIKDDFLNDEEILDLYNFFKSSITEGIEEVPSAFIEWLSQSASTMSEFVKDKNHFIELVKKGKFLEDMKNNFPNLYSKLQSDTAKPENSLDTQIIKLRNIAKENPEKAKNILDILNRELS